MNKCIRSIAVAGLIGMMVPVASYAMCGVPWGKCDRGKWKSDVLPIQTSPKQDKKPVPVVAPDNAYTPSTPVRRPPSDMEEAQRRFDRNIREMESIAEDNRKNLNKSGVVAPDYDLNKMYGSGTRN